MSSKPNKSSNNDAMWLDNDIMHVVPITMVHSIEPDKSHTPLLGNDLSNTTGHIHSSWAMTKFTNNTMICMTILCTYFTYIKYVHTNTILLIFCKSYTYRNTHRYYHLCPDIWTHTYDSPTITNLSIINYSTNNSPILLLLHQNSTYITSSIHFYTYNV